MIRPSASREPQHTRRRRGLLRPLRICSTSPRDTNMNVSLPEELANIVKDKVSTGRYGSSSEVVHGALRLMERTEQQEAQKLALLRLVSKEGHRQ